MYLQFCPGRSSLVFPALCFSRRFFFLYLSYPFARSFARRRVGDIGGAISTWESRVGVSSGIQEFESKCRRSSKGNELETKRYAPVTAKTWKKKEVPKAVSRAEVSIPGMGKTLDLAAVSQAAKKLKTCAAVELPAR